MPKGVLENRRITAIPLYAVLMFSLACGKGKENVTLEDQYLGQPLPGIKAEVFAKGIVTTADHEHSRVEFSKDGRMIFWTAMPAPPGSGAQRMFYVERTNEGWSDPAVPGFLQNPTCGSPAFSSSGDAFYYISRDPASPENERPGRQQLWKVERNGTDWEEPRVVEDLLPVVAGTVTMAFCFAVNDNLYIDAGGPGDGGEWSWEIYVREYHGGKYAPPEKLGGGINASRVNWCPFISSDESYIIFSSDRTGPDDFGDLYVSFRDPSGNWTGPVNMGTAVNTNSQERFPSVSPDGKYLFFARNMDETFSDVYWVDAKIIDALKTQTTD